MPETHTQLRAQRGKRETRQEFPHTRSHGSDNRDDTQKRRQDVRHTWQVGSPSLQRVLDVAASAAAVAVAAPADSSLVQSLWGERESRVSVDTACLEVGCDKTT